MGEQYNAAESSCFVSFSWPAAFLLFALAIRHAAPRILGSSNRIALDPLEMPWNNKFSVRHFLFASPVLQLAGRQALLVLL